MFGVFNTQTIVKLLLSPKMLFFFNLTTRFEPFDKHYQVKNIQNVGLISVYVLMLLSKLSISVFSLLNNLDSMTILRDYCQKLGNIFRERRFSLGIQTQHRKWCGCLWCLPINRLFCFNFVLLCVK